MPSSARPSPPLLPASVAAAGVRVAHAQGSDGLSGEPAAAPGQADFHARLAAVLAVIGADDWLSGVLQSGLRVAIDVLAAAGFESRGMRRSPMLRRGSTTFWVGCSVLLRDPCFGKSVFVSCLVNGTSAGLAEANAELRYELCEPDFDSGPACDEWPVFRAVTCAEAPKTGALEDTALPAEAVSAHWRAHLGSVPAAHFETHARRLFGLHRATPDA